MTLKQLEAFYWAAHCASFQLAAERVHVSVSSLSKRIAELELYLGKPLFDRSGHKALLTDIGQLLLPQAQAMLQQAETMRLTVVQDAALRGVCHFGVGELTALTWLPRFIAVVRERHPELRLEPSVEAGSSLGSLEQKVFDRVLDFAIIARRPTREDVMSEHVAESHFKWVGAKSLVGGASGVTQDMLARLPVICLSSGTGTMQVLNDWLDHNGISIGQRLMCNSWGAVAGLLAEGLGIGILPVSWAAALAQGGQVQMLKSRRAMAPLRYCMQWRGDDKRALIEGMLQAVKDTVDFKQSGGWLHR
jgi:DNA-binding transcriptional LysR family regulator